MSTDFTGPKTIKEWQTCIHTWAKRKGWWVEREEDSILRPDAFGNLRPSNVGELLMLIEASEAMDHYRNGHDVDEEFEAPDEPGKPDGIPSELADIVIRVLDMAEAYDIDLQAVTERKMVYNDSRPYRHGGKRA